MDRDIYTLYMLANVGHNLNDMEWIENDKWFLKLTKRAIAKVDRLFLYKFIEVLKFLYQFYIVKIDKLREFADVIDDQALKEDIKRLEWWLKLYEQKRDGITIEDLKKSMQEVGLRFNYDFKQLFKLYSKYHKEKESDVELVKLMIYPYVFNKQYQTALELILSIHELLNDWIESYWGHSALPMIVEYLDRLYRVFDTIPRFWEREFISLRDGWRLGVYSTNKNIMTQHILPEFRKFIKEHALNKKEEKYYIESQQVRKLYPKQLTEENIYSKLVNLYAGFTMLQRWKLDKEDGEKLQKVLFENYMTPIIQSIFYDVITHYTEELEEFFSVYKRYMERLSYLVNEFPKEIERDLKKKGVEEVKIKNILKNIQEVGKELANTPCHNLLIELNKEIDRRLLEGHKLSINDWISLMNKIPYDIWREHSKCFNKQYFAPAKEKLAKVLLDINVLLNSFDIFRKIIPNDFYLPFTYFDFPYFNAFYNELRPLFQKWVAYFQHPTLKKLSDLMLALDRIKDLQHHSNFFWTSINKETMDFISSAKQLQNLVKEVNDSVILDIYRKYKFVYREDKYKFINQTLQILLELAQQEKVYPKKINAEDLKHYLSNLYFGEYLLHNKNLSENDKKIIGVELYYSAVLPIVQSIFYDSIKHFKGEVRQLMLATRSVEYNFHDITNFSLHVLKYSLEEGGISKEVRDTVINNIQDVIKEIENSQCMQDLRKLLNVLVEQKEKISKYLYKMTGVKFDENMAIDDWINLMLKIDKEAWYRFGMKCKEEARRLLLKYQLVFSKSIYPKEVRPYIPEMHSDYLVSPFYYLDEPYYRGFYEGLLPLYKVFVKYKESFSSNLLSELIMQIDHLKDLRHHGDFFWTSLDREAMDFIKNANIKDLYKFVTSSTLKKIYRSYYKVINVEFLTLSYKLKIFFESLSKKEIYPKKFSDDELKSYLSTLYVGSTLLSHKLDTNDVNVVLQEITDNAILPVIQSIFYDTIGHYRKEADQFLKMKRLFNMVFLFTLKFLDYIKDIMKKYSANFENQPKVKRWIITTIEHYKKLLETYPVLKDIKVLGDILSKYSTLHTTDTMPSIEQWIQDMKRIPTHIWKRHCEYKSNPITPKFRSFLKELMLIFSDIDKEFVKKLESYLRTMLPYFDIIFYYYDEPYYYAFYEELLPLYELFKEYLLNPTIQKLNKLIIKIDHIKDLQHHTDFFWISISKETMDFIFNASINELLPYTSSTIKSIYKKYRFIFK